MNKLKIEIIRYRSAWGYFKNRNVSALQAFLKNSLIPIKLLEYYLPEKGTILDLGCGEGILSNLIAHLSPNRKVIGIDIDSGRLKIAEKNAAENAIFNNFDMFDLPDSLEADAVIINDVVHHKPYSRHAELISTVARHITNGGILILKEVDQNDIADRVWTSMFDKKLYPSDRLCFRTVSEWSSLLKRHGFKVIAVEKNKHPWPASRTLLIAKKLNPEEVVDIDSTISRMNEIQNKTDHVLVFITGATGFIGSHVAQYLLKYGLDGRKVHLLLLARDLDRIPENLRGEDISPILGELEDLPRLGKYFSKVEYVFHFAAEVKFKGGADVYRHNLDGTISLLKAFENIKLKRFIHASTMGALDRKATDSCNRPLIEADEPNPLSDYGKAKLASEQEVINSGQDYSIIRVTWGYGSGMTPDTHVRNLMQSVYDHKIFSNFNFPGKVSIISVEDLARIFTLVAEKKETKNQVYFASDGVPVSLGDLFKVMAEFTGKKTANISIPVGVSSIARKLRALLPLTVQNLNSDVLCASNQKLIEIGIKPIISKREGIKVLASSLGLCPYTYLEEERLISLITGAASGIGRELAKKLYEEGHALLLVDKNKSALEQLTTELDGSIGLCLDLTEIEELKSLSNFIDENKYCLDWVVNNAGIGARGLVQNLTFDQQLKIIQLNIIATTYISRLAVTKFLQTKHGLLINIVSSSAFQPMPFMAVYAASKAYLLNFSRSLTGEIKNTPGVTIVTVNPSGTATNFQLNANVKQDPNEKLLSPVSVANTVITAIHKGKTEITIGINGFGMAMLARILPVSIQIRLWSSLMKNKR